MGDAEANTPSFSEKAAIAGYPMMRRRAFQKGLLSYLTPQLHQIIKRVALFLTNYEPTMRMSRLSLTQVALNNSIMVFAFATIVALLLGISAITVPWETLLISVGLYIVVPVILAQIARSLALSSDRPAGLKKRLARLQPVSLIALLSTLVLLFGFQGEQIIAEPLIIARGPLGAFTMRSRPEAPLLFVAGGTGIAPILSLLDQQAQAFPERDVVLLWGMKVAENFYAFDSLRSLLARVRRLRIVLVAERGAPPADDLRIEWAMGTVVDAIADDRSMLAERDLYAAGPAPMLHALGQQLDRWDIARVRIHMDSFGV